ncbi:MAG: ribosome small subunit-dependent GTPase A [Bacteroidota bacterium]
MPAKRKGKKAKSPVGTESTGIVVRSTGSRIWVKQTDGKLLEAVIRGKFRIKGIRSTNPVAVGDRVVVAQDEAQELAMITNILPRDNYLLRKSVNKSHEVHILASNIDQAVLVYTLEQPHTTTGFANRFMVIAEAYHIPVVMVVNKIDLLTSEGQLAKLEEVVNLYRDIGYEVLPISSLDESAKPKLVELFKDKTSFIGGHSGAGKSTLVNLVDPDLDLRTGDISDNTLKGRHTTTYAEMFELAPGGFLIDSPGIKEMGLSAFEAEELSHYFPEMYRLLGACKFNNCLHVHEPGCAIKKALEAGEIHPSRYNSYLSMLEEIQGG